MAQEALRKVAALLEFPHPFPARQRVLDEVVLSVLAEKSLPVTSRLRLAGRYGARAAEVLNLARQGELEPIGDTPSLWAELRWAARSEAVVHLDDLLLRRVRLGLTLPRGGSDLMERIRETVQEELGWSDDRWKTEVTAYQELWKTCYGVPSE
jgi:glycerol-3-phosphate dehydrogenase